MMQKFWQSSIGKKQIVAVSGLLLVGFLVSHLAGNLLIYLGPEAFNLYSKSLHSLGPGLRIIEAGLALVFFVHIGFTISVVKANRRARGQRYEVTTSSTKRSLATRLMPLTGSVLIVYILTHLMDFVFVTHHGPMSLIAGVDYGLYGLVVNTLRNPIKAIWYMVAMLAIGLHLVHALSSVFQTFGIFRGKWESGITTISYGIAGIISLAFASIPLYIFLMFGPN